MDKETARRALDGINDLISTLAPTSIDNKEIEKLWTLKLKIKEMQ